MIDHFADTKTIKIWQHWPACGEECEGKRSLFSLNIQEMEGKQIMEKEEDEEGLMNFV